MIAGIVTFTCYTSIVVITLAFVTSFVFLLRMFCGQIYSIPNKQSWRSNKDKWRKTSKHWKRTDKLCTNTRICFKLNLNHIMIKNRWSRRFYPRHSQYCSYQLLQLSKRTILALVHLIIDQTLHK